jgi:hypothetical protein
MSANPAMPPAVQSAGDSISRSEISLRALPFPLILRTSRHLGDDELLEFCAANDSLRIERNPAGELIVMTPAGGTTSNLEGYLSRELDLWVERTGRGIAFNSNGGFSLPDGSVRAPDASWLSSEKWNTLTRDQRAKFIPSPGSSIPSANWQQSTAPDKNPKPALSPNPSKAKVPSTASPSGCTASGNS